MNTVHTTECIARHEAVKAAEMAWCEQWPNYCKGCGGAGAFYDYGSRDEPPSSDYCESCAGKCLCGRCGLPGLTNEENGDETSGEGPCKLCGWNYDDIIPDSSRDCDCINHWAELYNPWETITISVVTAEGVPI